MIKVTVLQTGRVNVDIGIPLKQNNPLAPTGWFRSKKHRLWMPVSTYLIEHPKGLVLIDTGWNKEERVSKSSKFNIPKVAVSELPQGLSIDEQLKKLGISPENLDYVLISHMDGDHIGGLDVVSKAKKILVSKDEWRSSQKKINRFRYDSELWKESRIEQFEYEKSNIGPFNKSYDLFKDGTIQLVSTPGHSNGLFTTLINGNEQFAALIADTGYLKESWNDLHIPGITVSKKKAKKSLEWVKSISEDLRCYGIYANHDPEIRPHSFEL